jgi:hypothetical protein
MKVSTTYLYRSAFELERQSIYDALGCESKGCYQVKDGVEVEVASESYVRWQNEATGKWRNTAVKLSVYLSHESRMLRRSVKAKDGELDIEAVAKKIAELAQLKALDDATYSDSKIRDLAKAQQSKAMKAEAEAAGLNFDGFGGVVEWREDPGSPGRLTGKLRKALTIEQAAAVKALLQSF